MATANAITPNWNEIGSAGLINDFTRRRLNDAKIDFANNAMIALIQRIPASSDIDATKLANDAFAIAGAMTLASVNQRLI